MIPQLQDMPYEERLSALSLPSLLHRHLRGAMLYKILNGQIFPIFTPSQLHQPGAINSSCSSISRDYCADQIISLTE